MAETNVGAVRIPQGYGEWKGVDSAQWALDLQKLGFKKKAIAKFFGVSRVTLDKAINKFNGKKERRPDSQSAPALSTTDVATPEFSIVGATPDAQAHTPEV